MLAVVVYEPGGPEVLRVEKWPIPEARPGWVLVRVRAFGLNHSELITRVDGSGDGVSFPRVLGIECAGEVVEAPGSDLSTGQRIVAAMGGMGRDYDGGYEQYALVPASQAIPVETTLDWPHLGAIPESFGTAWGTLEELGLHGGQSLLVQPSHGYERSSRQADMGGVPYLTSASSAVRRDRRRARRLRCCSRWPTGKNRCPHDRPGHPPCSG